MRVGFDARVLGPEAGGIGRYARGLIGALAAQAETERLDFECWLFGPSAPLGELARSRVKVDPRWGQVRSGVLRALWCLPWSLRARRVEVFHGLDHVGLPVATGKARGVLTVHDLIPLRLPELVTPRFRTVARLFFRRAVRRADAIIAVSERTRADLVEQLAVPAGKITVIPEGVDPRFGSGEQPRGRERIRLRYGITGDYLLFVGTLEPKKNLEGLIRAYAAARQETGGAVPRLVIAGKTGWMCEGIFRTVTALDLEQAVLFPGFVEEPDLPDLYRGALGFVFPSLYEGFGLPVLEAMACGTPVITSTRGALPEVAGGAALLVDPESPGELAAAILRVVHDAALREELRQKGLARARGYSWEAAARQTLKLYQELA